MATLSHLLNSLTAVFLALMALLIIPIMGLIVLILAVPSATDCSVDLAWSRERLTINGNCRADSEIEALNTSAAQ